MCVHINKTVTEVWPSAYPKVQLNEPVAQVKVVYLMLVFILLLIMLQRKAEIKYDFT